MSLEATALGTNPWPRISWGLFLLVLLGAIAVAIGVPWTMATGTVLLIALLCAWRFPYPVFFLFLASSQLLGVVVSLPTGQLQFGERAFGGSIDVGLGELVAAVLLAAWALRILLLWRGRWADWKPWLPFAGAYALLFAAHLLSAFSWAAPEFLLVIKYALRPVLFVYLICVALPVNFIRTRPQLHSSLVVMALVGVFFALDGLRSMVDLSNGFALSRAHPSAILEVVPLGGNHNALAELLLFAVPAALVCASWAETRRRRHLWLWSAGGMTLVALLTFARSAWIALAVQFLFLGTTVWRPWLRRHRDWMMWLGVMAVPLVGVMAWYSLGTDVQGSTDARALVLNMAWYLFREHPWIGVGAGTFVEHVARVTAYTIDFGTAIDAHGLLQKLMAETGIVGLASFGLLIVWMTRHIRQVWQALWSQREDHRAYAYLVAGVLGAFAYQLFDTTYWTARLWLPVGFLWAAGAIFVRRRVSKDPDFLSPAL